MQLIEVALAPISGDETEPSDEAEQRYENDERDPIYVLHIVPLLIRLLSHCTIFVAESG
jgi:hypothetical protein